MKERYKMKKAFILIGIQACGKSTFCSQYLREAVHISLDDLHTRNKEKLLLTECIANGQDFVIDNTNPTKADRARYIPAAKEAGYTVIGYYFRSSIRESIARNAQRTGKARVPDAAVAATHNKLELPDMDEGFDLLYYVRMENGGFVTEIWKDESEG